MTNCSVNVAPLLPNADGDSVDSQEGGQSFIKALSDELQARLRRADVPSKVVDLRDNAFSVQAGSFVLGCSLRDKEWLQQIQKISTIKGQRVHAPLHTEKAESSEQFDEFFEKFIALCEPKRGKPYA